MSLKDNRQIQALVTSIDGSLEKLDELEHTYQQQKEQLTSELAGSVAQLGQLADSQALRAQLVRELYWNRKIPGDIIGEAFGLQIHRVLKIAGPLTMEFPCVNECGNAVKQTFTSRTDREKYFRESHGRKSRHHLARQLCHTCQQLIKDEEEQKESQRRAALRARDEQLKKMSWPEFIETKEWIKYRNEYIHYIGYRCEVCRASRVNLHIYLNADGVYGHPSSPQTRLICVVYCKDCKERCLDLIDEEKGEVIKAEFLPHIMNWNQGYHSSDDYS
jgi:hypothetical protein